MANDLMLVGIGGSDYSDALYGIATPSLDLQFAANKSLTDVRSGNNLITFTRASVGTYFDSAGVLQTASTNVPRFDHNPSTGESLGLLVEEQRTNLLLHSEDFATTWVPGNVTISANTTTSPSGATTADTLTVIAGATNANLYQAVSCNASTAYTFSVYIRLGTLAAADFRFAVRDDSNGAFIATDLTPNVSLSTSTWQRITYTFTTPAGCTLVRPYIYRYTSNSGGTFFAWGAQLEAGAFATSYIPTTAAAVTRDADVASITGTNFSSWYNQSEGTMYVEGAVPVGISGARAISSIDNGTNSERIQISHNGTTATLYLVVNNSVQQFNTTGGANSFPPGEYRKLAIAVKANDFAAISSTNTVVTGATGTMPVPTQLQIGFGPSRTQPNLPIKRITYFPIRISNQNLQRITQ